MGGTGFQPVFRGGTGFQPVFRGGTGFQPVQQPRAFHEHRAVKVFRLEAGTTQHRLEAGATPNQVPTSGGTPDADLPRALFCGMRYDGLL